MNVDVTLPMVCPKRAGGVLFCLQVDVLLYGADRVAANGDVANKIGTYQVCSSMGLN